MQNPETPQSGQSPYTALSAYRKQETAFTEHHSRTGPYSGSCGSMLPYLRLRQLRISKCLSQESIAAVLYCSQRTYSRYERGESKIPLPLLTKLASFYHTSVDYLLGVTDSTAAYPVRPGPMGKELRNKL